MNRKQRDLYKYCERHTTLPSDVIQQLERETHLKTLAPQMMSGHLQGRLLSMISKMIRPKVILEVGAFTGYSALCLAEGLAPGGHLHTIEMNPEYESLIRTYIGKADLEEKITLHMANALRLIPEMPFTFDLVFIDASKLAYKAYFELVIDKLNTGGYILADNLLWGGKVVGADNDKDTVSIRTFAQLVQNDNRLENVLLPLRDGLMICRKI